ncbi:SDR family oxidoreductase [Achromobacter sp. GG226]|uniref:SDR family oxidoreductase n=1 Tax=Verticiella alkaliphila TaxID=2779529 RepID=UPI001C0E3096|nr:SDR family oxidoreductase [Verticiella sp. GG226]MBU4609556.1 SDR family oxidoreductase [Verticiella sp. GG226]
MTTHLPGAPGTDAPALAQDAAQPAAAPAWLSRFSLAGQVALVTGARRGLGWEIARALAGCGAHVVLNGREAHALEAAAQSLREQGASASAAAFDVGDAPAMRAAFARLDAEHGRLDILVNNVGGRLRQPLQSLDDAQILGLLHTNLAAGVLLAREAAQRMLKQGSGRLIAITSIAGPQARAGDAIYATAKAGLAGLVRALAAEYGPHGITSNGIAPGGFATEANAAMVADPAVGAHFASRTPVGRWGRPEEIAGAAVFLASPAASYVNGHVLVVDGGMSIAM